MFEDFLTIGADNLEKSAKMKHLFEDFIADFEEKRPDYFMLLNKLPL